MRELGLYLISDPVLTIRERMHLVKKVGFDYVCAASMSQLMSEGEEGFIASAEREGLPIDNVHLTGSGTSLIWYDGAEGDDIVSRYCREMSAAVDVGIRLGVCHVTWGTKMPPFTEIGMDRLARIVEHAEKVGFRICFENSVSLKHFEEALARFKDSDNIGFCFDTGHWNEFFPEEDIYTKYNSLMKITHIEDNDGVKDLHLVPFDGCTDFEKIASSLKCMQRLTFEVKAPKVVSAKQTEVQLRERMKRIKIMDDEKLFKVYDYGYEKYPGLDYESFLLRIMASGVKLRDMVEAAPSL